MRERTRLAGYREEMVEIGYGGTWLLKGPEEEEEVGQTWSQKEGFPHFFRSAPSYFSGTIGLIPSMTLRRAA